MILKIILVLVAFISVANSENYCSRELSCGNYRNIMCNAQNQFSGNCRDASIVPITNSLRQRFLRGHNQRRSFVARGKLGGFYRPAARMATIVWDSELERMALQNVFQCEMQHDHCRKTRHYPYAGQNLAMRCRSPTYEPVDTAVEKSMKAWFDEYTILPQQYLYAYGRGPQPRGMVGHFTQMARDKAFAMGCAIVKSVSARMRGMSCYFIACNYATTNMNGSPVYEVGRMGSKCRSGMNRNYPGLCSERENYFDDNVLFHG